MAIRELLYYPDEHLHLPSAPVTEFDDSLADLVSDMFETMYHDEGIGLAAPQINIRKRVVVMDIEGDRLPEHQIVLINPEFVSKEGSDSIEEGCLSVPGLRARINRAENVTVKAQNLKGEFFTISATGLQAICIQHEIDHLDGHLFIDYLSPMKKKLYRAKAAKLARERKRAARESQ